MKSNTAPKFMHNTLAITILVALDISHFKGDILRNVSSSNPFLYNRREPKYKQNNIGHQISRHFRLSNVKSFWNLISHSYLLISWLPNMVQKCFSKTPSKSSKNKFFPNILYIFLLIFVWKLSKIQVSGFRRILRCAPYA